MDPISRYLQDTTPLPSLEQQVLALFQQLECGRLRLGFPSGQVIQLRGALPGPEADLSLLHPGSLAALVTEGLSALPAAYAHGTWQSRDLTRLLYLFCLNPLLFPAPVPQKPRLRERLRTLLPLRHHAVAAAHPLSIIKTAPLPDAAFFAIWLGASLDDGPGLFQADNDTPLLAQATAAEVLLKALGEVRTKDHILEIGGGWGALSEGLCRSGARLTVQSAHPITARHIHARLATLALRQPVTVKEAPLARLAGRYDRIVWVWRPSEPLPAAASEDWAAVFRQLKTLLKQGGRMVAQIATVTPGTASGLPSVLFPEGAPPPRDTVLDAAAAAYLDAGAPLIFGEGTARLYGLWRTALEATCHVDTPVPAQTEARRWLYRLAALEAAHLAGTLTTAQYTFTHRIAA